MTKHTSTNSGLKKQNLKTHTVEFYEEQTLATDQLERLLAMSTLSEETKQNNFQSWFDSFTRLPIRAAATIALLILPFIFIQMNLNSGNINIVPQEIALNHNKHLTLEYKSEDYSELNNLMTKLDFQLIASNNPTLSHLKPLGARYCSIQGNLAAQIRLIDNTGKLYTLYQTPMTQSLLKSDFATQSVENLLISQWQEQDLFFGLASPL